MANVVKREYNSDGSELYVLRDDGSVTFGGTISVQSSKDAAELSDNDILLKAQVEACIASAISGASSVQIVTWEDDD